MKCNDVHFITVFDSPQAVYSSDAAPAAVDDRIYAEVWQNRVVDNLLRCHILASAHERLPCEEC
jgi:hypothetical protein